MKKLLALIYQLAQFGATVFKKLFAGANTTPDAGQSITTPETEQSITTPDAGQSIDVSPELLVKIHAGWWKKKREK